MRTGTPFAKQFTKELQEVSGKSCTFTAVKGVAGARKPSESQKGQKLCGR